MDKLWVVIKREYVERVRSKWFIFTTIFGPVFFAAITILPSYVTMKGMKNAHVATIHILDATGTGLGHRVADRLLSKRDSAAVRASPMRRGLPASPDAMSGDVEDVTPLKLAMAESLATKSVMENTSPGYLVLDSATLDKHTARYFGRNASAVGQMDLLQEAIRQSLIAARLEAAGLKPERIDSLVKVKVDLSSVRLDERGRGDSGLVSFVFGFVIAFMLYMMIMIYGQNVMRGVLEEKMTRVAEVVMASVKPDILLAGKIIGIGAVALTQQIVWFGSAAVFITYGAVMAKAMGAPGMENIALPTISPILFISLFLFFILGFILYSAMFAAVGAMVGTQEEVQQAAMPVVFLMIASILFVQPVMLAPSSTLAIVLSVNPFTAPVIMPLRMSAIQVPPIELVGSLAGLVIACLAAIWASARIYRIGLLMTGKRPTMKELMRWIKYA
ncbi:MAG TPA: ABC transporter permease [Gemmatimonadaceae bacterium]|jgi:ABC-2 type transport system permease protein|nr:ABC transporter permease [Gemmatimonadaceae bacterium]